MIAGKHHEYKKKVIECDNESMIEAFGIQVWDRFQRITEYDKSNWEIPEEKSENFMISGLTIFPGRTKEQKKAAIKIITDKVSQRLDISPPDIFIVMNEPPLDNWGMGGKQKS